MLSTNSVLQDRYRIIRKLGAGGMGAVYEAIDQRLNSVVALKEILIDKTEVRRSFEREASLLANLSHPALPVVIDYFFEEHEQFLVMQHIPGDDLAQTLNRRGAAFAVAEVLTWADQLLDALEYLHTHQPPIVHRDIKPSNIKLGSRGQVVLLDFGLAKGSLGQMPTAIDTRSMFGFSRAYAPLEQIHGIETDPRSDIYALGATLYHLITGAIPIDAPTRYDATEEGRDDPLRLAHEVNLDVPAKISDVIRVAMAISRKDRPESAGAMRVALRAAIDNDLREGEQTTQRLPVPVIPTDVLRPEKPSDSPQTKQWNESSFLRTLITKRGQAEANVAMRILEWCKPRFSRIQWGHGKQDGSFAPILDSPGGTYFSFIVYTYGRVEMQFQYMNVPPFDADGKRLELLRRLNSIPGISIPEDGIKRRPSLPLFNLRDDAALNLFFETFEWVINGVNSARGVNRPDQSSIGNAATTVGGQPIDDEETRPHLAVNPTVKELQLEYWTALNKLLRKHNSVVRLKQPRPYFSITGFLGHPKVELFATANTKHGRISVGVRVFNRKDIYRALEKQRDSIEREIIGGNVDATLSFDWRESKTFQTISEVSLCRDDSNINRRASWPEYLEWHREKLESFYRVFDPKVRKFPASHARSASNSTSSSDAKRDRRGSAGAKTFTPFLGATQTGRPGTSRYIVSFEAAYAVTGKPAPPVKRAWRAFDAETATRLVLNHYRSEGIVPAKGKAGAVTCKLIPGSKV